VHVGWVNRLLFNPVQSSDFTEHLLNWLKHCAAPCLSEQAERFLWQAERPTSLVPGAPFLEHIDSAMGSLASSKHD
jgi:hypothetical protein